MSVLNTYSIKIPGKWILTGEHSVLRGSSAIALPRKDIFLEFFYENQAQSLVSNIKDIDQLLFQAQLFFNKHAIDQRVPKQGYIQVNSTIPQSVGAGSSAALCVAIAKWLTQDHPSLTFSLAVYLENFYHGRSSGLDIAVVLYQVPILFCLCTQGIMPLKKSLNSKITFHMTCLPFSTKEAIQKVQTLWSLNPALALSIDQKMQKASSWALQAFQIGADQSALLAKAMQLGQSCFYDWNLVPVKVQEQEEALYQKGALAVKLTGKGNGGILCALWK